MNAAGIAIDTSPFLADPLRFRIAWGFQYLPVSSLDTLDGTAMTNLTGALANAIANTKPVAQITRVYVHIKDSYSFNDDSPSKSQYIGHWNKNEMVLSYVAAANDFFESSNLNVGKSTIEE